ncbi:MAG: hypothetical protein C4278_01385 [Patescibacteria group bacterium]
MRKRKNTTLSPPIFYWSLINFILLTGVIILIFLLIKERNYLEESKYLINKYRIHLSTNFFSTNYKMLNYFNHPASPVSSTNIIYLYPESMTLLSQKNEK